jgi:protein-disulfide isomerase
MAAQAISSAYTGARVSHLLQVRHDEIYDDVNYAVLGNAKAPNTLVEFFDYRCGHCRANALTIDRVLSSNNRLRIILRELPIFGADSEYLARIALTVGRHGKEKYAEFYRQVMLRNPPSVDRSLIDEAIAKLGLDPAQISAESRNPSIGEAIDRTRDLARALHVTGTPSFVIGSKVKLGEMSEQEMTQVASTVPWFPD